MPGAFNFNTNTANITNAIKNDITITYLDPYTISYSGSTFSETAANTGLLSGSSTISLTGTTFTGSNGDNFVSNGKVIVSNLPAGLTATVTKVSANQVNLAITGNATNHANTNDIANLTLAFQSSAFASGDASGVVGSTKSDFIIDYIDPYSISFDTLSVDENVQNVGTITQTMTITLTGHQFSGTNGDDFVLSGKVAIANLPAGLTAVVTRNSNTELEFSFSGAATSHANANDVGNLSFTLQDSALISGALAADVVGYNPSNLSIDFLPPYTLSANGTGFNEGGANDGSITDTITYTLVGTTFAGANGRDLVADGDVTLANIPAGLTAVVTKIDTNNVSLSFSGTATSHAVVNNSNNTDITFLAGAFSSGNAGGVTPNNFTGLTFSWDDPPSLSYSPLTFNESTPNIGGTTTSVSIFAANKTFDGTLGENFVTASKVTVSGHPAGLTPVVTYASANQVNLTFTGNATNNDDADDMASGISVVFANSAFVGGNAAQVVNFSFNSLGIDFLDPYQISYASTALSESSLNDGSIANSLSITLSGTLYAGSIGEDYVVSGKATVNNLPAGLTASVTKLSTSLAEVSITGNATSHEASDSIANLEVVFANTAFQSGAAGGVTNSTKSDLSITFNDTAIVSYTASAFNEAISNIGAIGNSINITLANDTFNGPDGENFISTGKVSATNVPVGLIPTVTKVDATTLSFSLTSNAVAHENAHDISNLTLAFAGSAFAFNSNPGSVTGSSKSDFSIDFLDAYSIAYSGTSVSESAANDGSISDTLDIDLTGTTYTGTNGDDFVAGGKVTVSNVPSGLTAVVTRTSNTQVQLSFTGNATSNLNSHDISNLTVIFADSAFTSGKSAGVTGYSRSDLSVDFDDQPFLTYASGSFAEAVANTGGVSTTLDVTLTNATFSGTDGDIYTPGTQVTFSNVPAGLAASAQKIDATTVRFSFTGSATSHGAADSISNFGVQFNNAAFNTVLAANVTGTSKTDYAVNFINPYSIGYGGATFTENVANVGGIDTSINITVLGTTFTKNNGDTYTNGVDVNFFNIPAGLTPVLTKVNSTTVALTFSGTATSHGLGNSITNFGISLEDSAFSSGASAGVSNSTKIDFAVNFSDPYTIAYSLPGFQESSSNNGAVGTTVDIDLTGTTFTGTNGSNYTSGTQYTVANVPAGLTAVVFKASSTKLTVFFTGNATSHENVNDIANFTISLNNAAFTSGAAAGVTNSSKSDFFVDFISGATLAYDTATFNEAATNIGSIDTTATITLANDTFTGVNGENFISTGKISASNVPSGLTVVATKVDANNIAITLSGNATSHLNVDDISNLGLTFAASAFTFNTDATTVANYNKTDLAIDFIDQYSLAYDISTMSEAAANDGSIGNNIVITLSGSTQFTGTNGDNFIAAGKATVSNLPTGLTAVVTKDSNTQVTLSLTGNASVHANSNDISNFGIVFSDTAFSTGASAGVDNSSKNDIILDFNDQPSLAYGGNVFQESAANIGGVTDTIDITLTNATFTGTDGAFYSSGSEFSASNIPAGLTMAVQKISATLVRVSFTGTATSHASSNSVVNIGIQFNNAAFNTVLASNVSNNSKSDFALNYRDPYTLAYSGSIFTESVANTGAIDTTVNVTVAGTTFTGTNGVNYTNGAEYSVANLPAGLGVQVQKVSDTVVQISLTANATAHANVNDISNFTINFLNAAFTSGNASGVNDTTKADFTIDFMDPYSIAYSAGGVSEDGANNGSITDTIDIDLTGTSFTGTNGVAYVASTQYTVANVPAGLTAVVTKINSTKLRLSFTGTASSHAAANNITNLTLNLLDAAFVSNAAAGVTDSSKADYTVTFFDNASLSYSSGTFTEDASNIGTLSNIITITMTNDTFSGLNGENYVSTSKASFSGLPAGLTGTITKTSSTTVDIALTGSAAAHANANDLSTVGVTFTANAFDFNTDATTVANYSKTDINLDYIDPYLLSYGGGIFTEAAANNGSIGNSIVLTLSGGANFTGVNTDDFVAGGKVAVTNVPAGLTAVATRDSATQITLTLTGAATNNLNSNDISTLTYVFADTAFDTGAAAGVTNSTKTDVAIDFNDQPSLAYSGSTLLEANANTGGIAGQIDITLTGDTFTGNNGDVYTATEVTYSNIPAGLTARIERISATVVRLTFTGNASAHTIANNVSNIGLAFQNGAFTNVAATNITEASKSDVALSYKDPYTLAYSAAGFTEALTNDGAVDSTVDITLTGTTFTGANASTYAASTQYTIANLPAGLTFVVTKVNDSTLRLSFTGTATAHADGDDVSNFTINLLDAAFTSGAAAGVNNTTKSDFTIDYLPPATLSWSASTFTESNLNDGSIGNTITLDIVNDTFTGAINSDPIGNGDIVVNNLPAGLTAVGQKINSTQIVISLTSNATNHANAHDISNLEFVSQSSLFTNNNTATNVTNYQLTGVTVDFEDPYVLSYSTSSLNEASSNDGAVSETITINLTGTTFTGTNGDNFAGTKATISNHPTGLTPVLTKNSNSQLTLSFTGTASSHADAQDVSNITIVFADGAFASGAAAGVDNSTKNDIAIDFRNLASIAYDSGTFSESGTNVGAIGNTITLTLTDDIFTGTNGDNFAGNGNATVSNVPAGLTATLVRASDTTLTLSLNGSATNHANSDDVSNISVVLAASAFSFNSNATLVTNYSKTDVAVDYADPFAIAYSATALAEAITNDGAIAATLTLDLTGTTFTGTNGDNFVPAKATVSNVPAGLTAVVTRNSATQLALSFTGTATNHEATHSISNLAVSLLDGAFTSGAAAGVTDSNKTGMSINFDNKPSLAYSHTALPEDVKNIGEITTALVIDLTGETFATGAFDTSKVTVTNLPAGLGYTATRNSATQIQIDFTGAASAHASTDDIANLTVTFLDAAFANVAASNITNSTNSSIAINYIDPYVLSFSGGTFSEAASNDGAIATTITATIAGTGFNTPAIDMITNGFVTINNIPLGLAANVVRDSSTQVSISFTSAATSHANADDISNLEIIFNDSAFISGESDGVTGSTKSDFNIDYVDPASLSYASATFVEDTSNDGTLPNTIDITLASDTFTGSVSDNFAGTKANISNVPAGHTATLTKIDATTVRLALTGSGTNHENINDISNLTVEFVASAFTNNTVAANVTGYLKNDIIIDYADAYSISYAASSVSENIANDGSITETVNISLTGTSFVAGTDFVTESHVTITNKPAGLTVVLTRVDANNLTLSFTGSASAHEAANNVTNFGIEFLDSAFTTGNAAGIVNYQNLTFAINYTDQAVISYSTDTFSEAALNDGSIGNTINISITNGEFTGANSSDFVADSKVTITNVPVAYTATLTKISNTTLTLALSGAAANGDHEDADDISNVTVDFNDTAVTSARADLTVNETKSDIKIDYADVVLPAISNMAAPADGWYKVGQTMSFVATFTEDVDVTGTPRLVINMGGETKYATYVSGHTTSALTFEYVTQNGSAPADQDLDGIQFSSTSIDLNGGTIKKKNDAINNALITFSSPNMANVKVDTVDPGSITGLIIGTAGVLSTQNTAIGSASPAISWTNPSGPDDNIDHIEVGIGTAAGADNIISFTDVGNVATHTFTGVAPDWTQCSGGSPLYYPVVRVHDEADNTSPTIANAGGFLYDSIDPTNPTVTATTFDATNTASATITWTAGSDACGIASYEMAIGWDADSSGTLEAGEVGNVVGWTDVGNVLSAKLTGLTLTDNTNYYTSIRTIDITGRTSGTVGATSARWRANFNYRRDVTIAPATSVADSHVMVTLNSGNFTYANAQSDLSDLRFFTTADVALDYWIEYHDATDETRIWVKIPATATSTIVMKYGTVNLTDGQDKAATFSYATEQDLYVEMQGHQTNKTLSVASYVDSNSVTISTSSSGTQSLDEGDLFSFASVEQAVITAKGPISGRVLDDNPAYEAIVPLSEAVTEFGYPVSRHNTDRYRFYNPNTTDADVTINAFYANGNAFPGGVTTITVPAGGFAYSADVDPNNSGNQNTGSIVFVGSSTLPVIPYYYGNSNLDGNVQPQASTRLFGVPSSQGYVSCTQNSTSFTVYRSSNSIRAQDTYACNDGQRINISDGNYAQGIAPSVNIVSNNPIFGTSQADRDGSESAAFMGLDSLGRDYIIPTNSEYIVIACPYAATSIDVYDETESVVYSTTCNANGNFPGKAKVLASQFSLSRMAPGYRIKGNNPFYVMYEYENQDETSVYPAKAARKYLETPLATTVSGTEY
ncbi:MAG: DUF2341 domain-containing protein [Bacteriovoracaceae bacterium]|nr:DUF2341 domain-containing protein [Bacteriovoracaceae bacterium]